VVVVMMMMMMMMLMTGEGMTDSHLARSPCGEQ